MFHRKSKTETDSLKKGKSNANSKQKEERSEKRISTNNHLVFLSSKQKSKESNGNNNSSPNNINGTFDKKNKTLNDNQTNMPDTQQLSRESDLIPKLQAELSQLKLVYKTEIDKIKKENENLQRQINQTKTELIDLLMVKNSSLISSLNQLDVAIRVLSKVVTDTQDHYAKFVPFVLDIILRLTRKQEYVYQQQKQSRIPKFDSYTVSYCNSTNSNSRPYSISMSPVGDTEMYKLIFMPIEDINISKVSEDANEHVFSLPIHHHSSPKILHHSTSVQYENKEFCAYSQLNSGSKTISHVDRPEMSILLNNRSSSNDKSRKFQFNNSIIDSMTNCATRGYTQQDLQLLKNFPQKKFQFRDLKNRYLKWKYRNFRSNSFPCLKVPLHIQENYAEENNEYSSKYDLNDSFCQSDTDLLGDKFFLNSNEISIQSSKVNMIYPETFIYQSFQISTIEELKRLKIKNSSLETISKNHNQEFSIILPQSKLSTILCNNFSNISELLVLNEDDENTTKSFDENNYLSFVSKSNTSPIIPLASFDSLSDDGNYMYDDYDQQKLLTDQLQNDADNSYEELCANLDQFKLPKCTMNDVFEMLK